MRTEYCQRVMRRIQLVCINIQWEEGGKEGWIEIQKGGRGGARDNLSLTISVCGYDIVYCRQYYQQMVALCVVVD